MNEIAKAARALLDAIAKFLLGLWIIFDDTVTRVLKWFGINGDK